MCGIFGVKRMGPGAERLNVWQIEQLGLEMQKRGGDATGVCFQKRDGTLLWHKQPLIAWSFLRSTPWQRFLEEAGMDADGFLPNDVMTVIGHTRAWTKGLPSNNLNNHPLINPDKPTTAVVHNGGVWNDDSLFKDLALPRVGEVDSDILRAILDAHGLNRRGVKELNKANGFVALAAVSVDYPDLLLLARSGSPLVIGLLEESAQLVFASTKDGIHKVSRKWIRKFGLDWQRNRSDLKFNSMEHDAALFITSDGIQEPVEGFNTTNNKHVVIYDVHGRYKESKRRQKHEANKAKVEKTAAKVVTGGTVRTQNPALVECPGCRRPVRLVNMELTTPLWELECGSCGQLLGEEK